MKSGNTIGMLLLASGIGFIAGILLAPDKGAHTRQKLADKAKKLASALDPDFAEHAKRQEEYEALLGL